MCYVRSPDGPAAGSSAKERSASWTRERESQAVVAREIGTTGRSFSLATTSAQGGG